MKGFKNYVIPQLKYQLCHKVSPTNQQKTHKFARQLDIHVKTLHLYHAFFTITKNQKKLQNCSTSKAVSSINIFWNILQTKKNHKKCIETCMLYSTKKKLRKIFFQIIFHIHQKFTKKPDWVKHSKKGVLQQINLCVV